MSEQAREARPECLRGAHHRCEGDDDNCACVCHTGKAGSPYDE